MKRVKLSNFIKQIRGVSYKPEDIRNELDKNAIPILRANNITADGHIDLNDIVYVDSKKVQNEQLLRAGDIFICASSGSKNLVGKAVYIPTDMPYAFGAFCKVVRPISENIDKHYLAQFFQSSSYRKKISDLAQGANINNIKNEHIDELDIAICSLEEQKAIAEKLDKVSGLIEKRKTQLSKLDELVKSRFIEMFIGNDYPYQTLDNLSLGKGEYGAASASIPYNPNRPRYVRITDINEDGTLNDDTVSSINLEDDENYKLTYGDFLFARMGATVGKTYAYKVGNEIFAGYLIRYKLNLNLINPQYLFWYTKLDVYKRWVIENQSGAAQPGINAKKYGGLQIPVPPIELQNEFAEFVKLIDKSKFEIQKSLEKLEILKKSLMQQYFG